MSQIVALKQNKCMHERKNMSAAGVLCVLYVLTLCVMLCLVTTEQ